MQEEYLDNSISLASKVEDSFEDLGKKIRGGGVKQAPFMVLHKAYMPRVLIEMGFISNTIEGNKLNSEEGQDEIAKAIADAIISYKKEYYGSGETEIFEERPSQKINEKPIRDTVTPVKPKTISQTVEATQTKKMVDNSKPIFKVQLSASIKRMELIPRNFNGLKDISVAYENRVYKYMYGETADYDEAKKQLSEAKDKGYNTAFLIAFKNGEKINIQDALK
jgi:N-acetylmuramoyl-L-alanine amidase